MQSINCYSVDYETTDISRETGVLGANIIKLKFATNHR